MSESNRITVVYATDYGYLKPTIVSAYSMLKNVAKKTNVDIVILVPSNMPSEAESVIIKALSEFNDYSLKLIRMGDEFDNINLTISHITSPTYYRLLLPALLPDVEKCIYIDGDTIVDGDISKLYAEDLGDNLVAGVKAFAFYRNDINVRNTLGYHKDEEFVYVNAGVLVFNLREMRASKTSELFMRLLPNQYPCQDQDIINIGCKGRVKTIPMFYNTMTKYALAPYSQVEKWATELEYNICKENPVIIHFADKIKPWNDLTIPWAEKWFEYSLSPAIWSLFYDVEIDRIKALIKSNTSSKAISRGKKNTIFAYIKQVGPKYAFNRAISAIKNRK